MPSVWVNYKKPKEKLDEKFNQVKLYECFDKPQMGMKEHVDRQEFVDDIVEFLQSSVHSDVAAIAIPAIKDRFDKK